MSPTTAGSRRLDEETLRELFDVGRGLVSDLELEHVLRRVLEAAVQITGARYAALGVLDRERSGLERFIHLGIDEQTRERIGDLPSGRGILGLLISEPRPVRLHDVSEHANSYGFPPNHPPMSTFLGVPIRILERQWGNLYLTEKENGADFTEEDERAVISLAEWAAIAIGNARSVATERLRLAMDAAEQERRQWARELHDATLQGLAAVRLMLATGRRDSDKLESAVDRSIEQIDHEIASLRDLITDLRPDSLQELGIVPGPGGAGEQDRVPRPGRADPGRGPARSRHPLVAGPGDRRLPGRPGGDHERDPPRRRGADRRIAVAGRRATSSRGSATTGPGSCPREPSSASGSSACVSARSSPRGISRSTRRRGRARW